MHTYLNCKHLIYDLCLSLTLMANFWASYNQFSVLFLNIYQLITTFTLFLCCSCIQLLIFVVVKCYRLSIYVGMGDKST